MAACRVGSASTANTVSADVLIVVVALTVSSVMVAGLRFLWSLTVLRGKVLSCPTMQTTRRSRTHRSVAADRFAASHHERRSCHLVKHKTRQDAERLALGPAWKDHD